MTKTNKKKGEKLAIKTNPNTRAKAFQGKHKLRLNQKKLREIKKNKKQPTARIELAASTLLNLSNGDRSVTRYHCAKRAETLNDTAAKSITIM